MSVRIAFPSKLWIEPLLQARKDIWTFFPVTVVPLGSDENGAECHAVQWHMKNLHSWIRLWGMPRMAIYDRLMVSLNRSSKWSVDPPKDTTMICVLRMRFNGSTPTVTSVSTPPLRYLNDIKRYYPVVWHRISSTSNNSIYSIELYTNVVAKMSAAAGYDVTQKVIKELMAALKESPSWLVFPSESKQEICRLQIIPRVQQMR